MDMERINDKMEKIKVKANRLQNIIVEFEYKLKGFKVMDIIKNGFYARQYKDTIKIVFKLYGCKILCKVLLVIPNAIVKICK